MTEAEWLASGQPSDLICHIGAHPAQDRKLRLFAVDAARLVELLMPDRDCVAALVVAERYADGFAGRDELWTHFRLLVDRWSGNPAERTAPIHAAHAAINCLDDRVGFHAAIHTCRAVQLATEQVPAGDKLQSDLLRDIFGNPFRPVTFAPSWRTDTAVALARQMYDSREFGAMPILADALQDAGCDNEDLLSHCRDAKQTHVRGCWVTDLVLGKK